MSNTSPSPDLGKTTLDGFGQAMDSMDFIKRAWSTFNIPSPFTPTLSVEELDKRIADLRAVEQWLALNQTMLRNTIQGLEIQRGTINVVKTLSDSFGKAIKPADDAMAQALARLAAAAARNAVPSSPDSNSPDPPSPHPESPPDPNSTDPYSTDPNPPASRGPAQASAPASDAMPAQARGPAAGDRLDSLQAGGITPLAWWNLLQSNFQQIAQAAIGGDGAGAAATGSPSASGSPSEGSPARFEGAATGAKAAKAAKGTKGAKDAKGAKGASGAKGGKALSTRKSR